MRSAPASPKRPAYRLGFTSLDRETTDARLAVDGELPPWLGGTLIRTGPARFEVGAQSYTHWFDGLAMLHKFTLGEGGVTYSSRFLRSRSFREAEEQNRIAHSEFMTDPCRTLFGRVMSLFDPRLTDNGCVNVAKLAGRMVALTETRMPVEFDPETLATIGFPGYAPAIRGQLSTAHPHHDGARGYSYVIAIGPRCCYRLLADDGDEQRLLCEIPVDEPAYMHSFGMSEHYLVLTEFPLRVSLRRLALSLEPFIRRYRWCPERETVITVIDKRDGRIVAKAHAPPCFAFHHVNAFEADGCISIDLIRYADASVIEQLRLKRLRAGELLSPAGQLTRFRVPLGQGIWGRPVAAEQELLSDTPFELPRIDYDRRAGRPYRFVWGTGQSKGGDFLDTVTRLELRDGGAADVKTWAAPGCYPGEPVFVARPGGTAESDGVLLTVVLDAARQRSFLLVLDADRLTELARAELPHHVPFGFHGNHFPSGS